jgi:sigma-E factor negative regulatory protein RseB
VTATAPAPVRGPSGSRRRVAAVVASAGLLLSAGPAVAGPARTEEAAALELLEQAAEASRTLSYRGTQYVAAWRPSAARSGLVEVSHEPGRGLVVDAAPTAGQDDAGAGLVAAGIDPRLLGVLRSQYALRVAGSGRCSGRAADVVEARRSGGGTVAGRFWVDRETGLLLRREVYDEAGERLRSSAFLDLAVAVPSPAVPTLTSAAALSTPARPDVEAMREDGWPVPRELPDGFALFDARPGADGVVRVAYSDGLSTTSLYVQRGELGATPPRGFGRRTLGGEPVWVHDGSPERVVWAGGGKVWTLVSDASDEVVQRAVAALPHADLPRAGLRARLGRGMARLGAMLNPFA